MSDNPILDGLDDDGDADNVVVQRTPRSYIREVVVGMFVGGIVAAITWFNDAWLSVLNLIRSESESIGGLILDQSGTVGAEIVRVIRLPITVAGDVAAAGGPLAPLLSALIFALVAATTGAIVVALYRIVRFI